MRLPYYFNNKLAGGKWRFMMSPEMGDGQWKSMRSTPPKINLREFEKIDTSNIKPTVTEPDKYAISIEAENFTKSNSFKGFNWKILKGLGKSGDSVTIFPNIAKTFANESPNLEYKFLVKDSADFEANFYLIPTQPLIPNNGLRFAFSVDNQLPQTIAVDKDTEVSSVKWSYNVLNQETVGKVKLKLEKGSHILKVFAIDTGVVLDKIILKPAEMPKGH